MENLPIRGSRAMLRKIETSAFVSSGCRLAEYESCGAKFTITFTFSGPSADTRFTGGYCLNGSVSPGCTALALMSSAICLSLEGSDAYTSQLEEQMRSARSRIIQST